MTHAHAKKPTQTSAPIPTGVLQRKCACGGSCAKCQGDERGKLRRKATGGREAGGVPPVVYDVLREPGTQLDAGTRAFFEPRFGADFGDVRVHTGSKAAASAQAVSAEAYTVGRDVVLGGTSPSVASDQGRQLLAHELTHTLQQGSHDPAGTTELTVGGTSTRHEREADAIATQALAEPLASSPLAVPAAEPAVMRRPLFNSTMSICHRVLKPQRVFRVDDGGVVISASARWEPSDEWQGEGPPECGRPTYHMTLTKKGWIDWGYGSCDFEHGTAVTQAWGNLPPGDYELTIWTNNTNPMCCLRGAIEVSQQRGLPKGCTKLPPGPLEMLHNALDLAGMFPGLGAFPDAINAGIYVIEGDWASAGLSAVAVVPLFGDATAAVVKGRKVLRISGEAIEKAGPQKIADALQDARAAERGGVSTHSTSFRGEVKGGGGGGRPPDLPSDPPTNVIDINTGRPLKQGEAAQRAATQQPFQGGPVPAAQKKVHKKTRKAFRDHVQDVIQNNPNHPLSFLWNAKTGKWSPDAKFDAGRIAHQRSGTPEIVGVEGSVRNQRKGRLYEKKGVGDVSNFVDIGGIPVEATTARMWVKQGKLKPEHIGPDVPGWSP